MASIKKETISGIKWSAVEKISLQAIQFVIGVILARLLSPDDFGVVGMLTIFIAISQTFVDGGFSNALIRKIDRTELDCSTTFFINVGVGLFVYLFLFFLAPYVANFFNTPILEDLLKVISISIIINSLLVVQIARLTAKIDFKSQAFATLISVLLSGSIAIVMAYKGYGVWALAWQTVLGAFIKGIFICCYSKWIPRWEFSYVSFRELFGYGSKILASNLLGTLYNNMTTLVIGKFYTSKDLGFYTRGHHFAHMPNVAIVDVLGRVTFPILAKIQNDDKRLITTYRKYIRATSMVVIFIMIMLAAVSKPLIIIVLTSKWNDCIIFLQIFCFAMMFDHISKINLNLLQVKGRSDLYLKLEIIKKVIAFCILLASIHFGVVAICISKIIYSQVALIINTYYTGKLFDLGYFKQLKDFGYYFIVSVLACIPSFILSTFTDINDALLLIICPTISIILYFIFLRKDVEFNEIKDIIMIKIKKFKK